MGKQKEYKQLMERIATAHCRFSKAWHENRTAAIKAVCPVDRPSYEQIWHANGIAYKAAEAHSDMRDQLLNQLFRHHLVPLWPDFIRGEPAAVDGIIDFLEVDVPAFRCGYLKEHYLRKLKTIPLTVDHEERLRKFGIRLCGLPHHRRELREAGRLMIRVADKAFVERLRTLVSEGNEFVQKRATKMLSVVLNGRRDLRV